MTTIGSFKANGNEFTGEIATLTIRATNVRISALQRATDKGPSHRVYAVQAEVGAAWTKRSRDGRAYMSVLLDDPSLLAPVYASLLAHENGRGHNLIWSRGTRRDRDRGASRLRREAPSTWSGTVARDAPANPTSVVTGQAAP